MSVPFMFGLIRPDTDAVSNFHFYNGVVSIYLKDAPDGLETIKNWQGVCVSAVSIYLCIYGLKF